MAGWIGVDLDGTLALWPPRQGQQIGDPIPAMVERVKRWLADGRDVRIMTARAAHCDERDLLLIQDWCQEHVGQELPVTCFKDFGMDVLFDDRARQVEMNTGRLIGQQAPHHSD